VIVQRPSFKHSAQRDRLDPVFDAHVADLELWEIGRRGLPSDIWAEVPNAAMTETLAAASAEITPAPLSLPVRSADWSCMRRRGR
jgi:hypothetical protein